jgi:hypothetical protein
MGPDKNTATLLDQLSKAMELCMVKKDIDEAITSTLDGKFLELANPNDPASAFILVGERNGLSAEQQKQIDSIQHQLDRIAPSVKIVDLNGLGSTGLAKETARRVNDIQNELRKIALQLPPGWFRHGPKCAVPKHACFVGHYEYCGRECYVWVERAGLPALADFTLSVLKLAAMFQETQVITAPSGVQYSPAFSRPAGGR